MIQLTRLNSQLLAVNSDLIKFVEQAPDTVVTLLTGEKILVRESADEIVARILHFRRAVLEGLCVGSSDLVSLRRNHAAITKADAAEESRG